jgi:hypothetical protein
METKRTLSWLGCALLALTVVACGGARAGAGGSTAGASAPLASRTALPQIETKADPDEDSDKYPKEQPDRDEVPYYRNEPFGYPADAADTRGAAAVVRRYYADAARGDGAAACRLLYSPRAEAMAGEDVGPASGHRGTCAGSLSRLFRQMHAHLSAEEATLRVGAVRVEFNQGSVQLRLAHVKLPHYIEVHRERGRWKLAMLLDLDRPVGVE